MSDTAHNSTSPFSTAFLNGATDDEELMLLNPSRAMAERYLAALAAKLSFDPAQTDEEYRETTRVEIAGFLSLETGTEGAREAHHILVEFLLPNSYIQACCALHQVALEKGQTELAAGCGSVMFMVRAALAIIDQRAHRRRITPQEAFSSMQRSSLDGSYEWQNFASILRLARDAAIQYIINGRDLIPDEADQALTIHNELTSGLDFGPEFKARLFSTSTTAIVLSLDFNSIWNVRESYPSQPLVSRAVHALEELANIMARRFPDKRIYVVINTGRPALYCWGAIELLKPVPALRDFALAEAGGAVLTEMHDGHINPAVEHPAIWEAELARLKAWLFARLRELPYVEPKASMLSIQVAKKPDQGGGFVVHVSDTGQAADEAWFQAKVPEFLKARRQELMAKAQRLRRRIGLEDGTGEIEEVLAEIAQDATGEIDEIYEELAILREMSRHLTVVFNPTAGFVDIFHGALNKYSTLMRELRKRGVEPRQALVVHIGDSSTDIMPETATGVGEANEGADQVYLVGAANSNDNLRAAVARRGIHGIMSQRESILALLAMIRGVTKVIKANAA